MFREGGTTLSQCRPNDVFRRTHHSPICLLYIGVMLHDCPTEIYHRIVQSTQGNNCSFTGANHPAFILTQQIMVCFCYAALLSEYLNAVAQTFLGILQAFDHLMFCINGMINLTLA